MSSQSLCAFINFLIGDWSATQRDELTGWHSILHQRPSTWLGRRFVQGQLLISNSISKLDCFGNGEVVIQAQMLHPPNSGIQVDLFRVTFIPRCCWVSCWGGVMQIGQADHLTANSDDWVGCWVLASCTVLNDHYGRQN